MESNPEVGTTGTYELTVTSSNGCTNISSVFVDQNGALPDLQINNDTLTCLTNSLELEIETTTAGITYAWSGPNNFSSTISNPTISESGEYILTITAPNGCQAVGSTMIFENQDSPDFEILPDTLGCGENTLIINTITTSSDLFYSWQGPNGFISAEANPTINTAGDYQVSVTGVNGCCLLYTSPSPRD